VNGRPARNIRVGSTRWRGVAGRRLSRRRLSCWCSEVTTGWVSTGCRRLRGGIWRGLSGRRRIRMISVWVGIGSICCEREQRTSEACSRGMAEPAGLPGFCRFRLRELGNFPKLPTLCLFRLRLRGWGFGRLGFGGVGVNGSLFGLTALQSVRAPKVGSVCFLLLSRACTPSCAASCRAPWALLARQHKVAAELRHRIAKHGTTPHDQARLRRLYAALWPRSGLPIPNPKPERRNALTKGITHEQ
jgi:hypothetical protein